MTDAGDADATKVIDRRHFMACCSALGLGGTRLPQLLWQRLPDAREITAEMLQGAEAIADLDFTDAERSLVLKAVNEQVSFYRQLRALHIPPTTSPAMRFDPIVRGTKLQAERKPLRMSRASRVVRPADLEDVAFWSVRRMAELLRTRKVSCLELTEMYLRRLERHAGKLECVVTLTSERALHEARRADAEIAQGRYRGPLHGIPWGVKDVFAARGYRTTWGAAPFRDQIFDEDSTVVARLSNAGAVLVAKLTTGELATGDVWFGGTTRNPWNPEQGSSGSSAGPASATAAGLVGFSVGSEAGGSILSPCTRCRVTGLRPTFGRVSHHGCMAAPWSIDKIGPICRGVEDCALVLDAINGPDGEDLSVRDVPFNWDARVRPSDLRVGYLEAAFAGSSETKENDLRALDVLRSMDVKLIPVTFPRDIPVGTLIIVQLCESAAFFDELTRDNRDELLVRQDEGGRPTRWRRARYVPAVEYIQANRVRTMLMEAMDRALAEVDVVVAPTFEQNIVLLTNVTGHPVVCVPNGVRQSDKMAVSISFLGRVYGEAETLALAKAYQDATGFHNQRPPLFSGRSGAGR